MSVPSSTPPQRPPAAGSLGPNLGPGGGQAPLPRWAFELHFREAGFRPALADDWACLLGAEPTGRPAIRPPCAAVMQLGMSVQDLAEGSSLKPVQLAVAGSVFLPVLEQLSNDSTFVGTAICDVLPGMLSGRAQVSYPTRQATQRLQQTRLCLAVKNCETNLRMLVQAYCVSRLPQPCGIVGRSENQSSMARNSNLAEPKSYCQIGARDKTTQNFRPSRSSEANRDLPTVSTPRARSIRITHARRLRSSRSNRWSSGSSRGVRRWCSCECPPVVERTNSRKMHSRGATNGTS